MAISKLKQEVLNYIEKADDDKIGALFLFIENELAPEYEVTEADMQELDRRWDNYLSGKSKSIPWEESLNNINKYIESKRKNAL